MLKLIYTPTPAGAPDQYGDVTDSLAVRGAAGDASVQSFLKADPSFAAPTDELGSAIDTWLAQRVYFRFACLHSKRHSHCSGSRVAGLLWSGSTQGLAACSCPTQCFFGEATTDCCTSGWTTEHCGQRRVITVAGGGRCSASGNGCHYATCARGHLSGWPTHD